VFDRNTGEPLEGAQVLLEGLGKGNLTDSSGHFTIHELELGDHTLLAQYMDYGQVRVPMHVRSADEGWVARFSLPRSGRKWPCPLVTFGFTVVVRDALTGVAPIGNVALRVGQDSLRTWAFGEGEVRDTAVVLSAYLAPIQPGVVPRSSSPVEVEVAALGYSLWWRDDVKAEFGECSAQLDTDPIHVWLLPRDARGDEGSWVTNAF
jgi:hypothetical protein